MEKFKKLLKELSIKNNFLNITILDEINDCISNKLIFLLNYYYKTQDKYLFFAKLVSFGDKLHKLIIKKNDVLSSQLYSLSGLIIPIIDKIIEICIDFNFELVKDLNKKIFDIIELEPSKYIDVKKNIKFLNIIVFCKNINYMSGKNVRFDDFGLMIKISNYHYKNIFLELIDEIGLFNSNDNKDKKYDWYWKAIEHNIDDVIIDELNIYNNTVYINDNKNVENFKDLENIEIVPDIIIENNDVKLEEFKIIQKSPENIIGIIENITNNTYSIIDQSKEQTSRILSNSIIIEDESFSIPIDNFNYLN